MQVEKLGFEPQKRKKSSILRIQEYVKNYAKKCRDSFNMMLTI